MRHELKGVEKCTRKLGRKPATREGGTLTVRISIQIGPIGSRARTRRPL